MTTSIRRVGILTAGGDAPGLNAVIRAVVKTATLGHQWQVLGIQDGFEGLLGTPRVRLLTAADVSGVLPRGGSVLGCTNRGHFKLGPLLETVVDDVCRQAASAITQLELDALIVAGGDGSHRIAHRLMQAGVSNIIGVPKTIDNDLAGTDTTFGFDTAVAFATDAIDRLHTTAESHGRIMVVEVMGREAGWIALYAGIAGGADVILLPEIPYLVSKVAAHINVRALAGKRFSIVVVAEGARPADASGPGDGRAGLRDRRGGVAEALARELEGITSREARPVVLGHLQRGGSPTASDRLLATAYGAAAVQAIADGQFGKMVAWRRGAMDLVAIDDALSAPRTVPSDHALIRTARGLGITFAGQADHWSQDLRHD
jgi:6-phosphofructokinase 1